MVQPITEREQTGGRGLGKVLFQEVDEAVGGRVVSRDRGGVLQLRFDLLRQLLPEFHPGGGMSDSGTALTFQSINIRLV